MNIAQLEIWNSKTGDLIDTRTLPYRDNAEAANDIIRFIETTYNRWCDVTVIRTNIHGNNVYGTCTHGRMVAVGKEQFHKDIIELLEK